MCIKAGLKKTQEKMSYVITAIAQNGTFSSADNDSISAFMKSIPVKLISFTPLSHSKATDFIIDIDLTKYYENNAIKANECDLNKVVDFIQSKIKADKINNVDLIFQKNDIHRKDKKLIVFDMDSTLIRQEVIELIAAQANVEEKVAEITTRAMNGELDFKQSLAARVALLRGIKSQTLWDDLKPQIQLTNGTKELCKFMKSKGCKLAVCSGGFLPLAEYVKEQLDLDYAFANLLETETDNSGIEILSGKTIGDIVDGTRKRELLITLANENDISLDKTVAVGDGANDLLMMHKAGYGIAWNAKPKVQLEAPCCLNSNSLKDALYIFGFNDEEIKECL